MLLIWLPHPRGFGTSLRGVPFMKEVLLSNSVFPFVLSRAVIVKIDQQVNYDVLLGISNNGKLEKLIITNKVPFFTYSYYETVLKKLFKVYLNVYNKQHKLWSSHLRKYRNYLKNWKLLF
jgi:hypothetical protein